MVTPDLELMTRSGAGLHYLCHAEGNYTPRWAFRRPSSVEAAKAAGWGELGYNVYFSLCPLVGLPRFGRGTVADVRGLSALWLDVDYGTAGHSQADLPNPATMADAVALVRSLPLQPTGIVHSGGGLYAYFGLTEPLTFHSEAELEFGAWLAKGWNAHAAKLAAARGLHLDQVGDLVRILRPVGSVNNKPGRDPRPVEVLEWSGALVDTEEVLRIIGPPPRAIAGAKHRSHPTEAELLGAAVGWASVLPGWTFLGYRAKDGAGQWRHPTATHGLSAVTDYQGAEGYLVCFSSTPGLPVRYRLDKAAVVAHLRFGGDRGRAIAHLKELAAS